MRRGGDVRPNLDRPGFEDSVAWRFRRYSGRARRLSANVSLQSYSRPGAAGLPDDPDSIAGDDRHRILDRAAVFQRMGLDHPTQRANAYRRSGLPGAHRRLSDRVYALVPVAAERHGLL